ncbi:hypothetical protein F5B22DRAFT_634844 [Xylaria bambusicola]|uniref:uncharacterized protein n=1 Tax=Xylaria bambusicola TaxID=326684 RepID=UPI0020073FB0|nr:uncharacterized protein F5B22DRAFT_634844 [Xylaria bambusicola]KAI0520998.1 hypothetical protein F5B22DRAFT_634844 [Xylaria bambusicola]
MSPESSSSLLPDRPIRPLPKRRLRERLSPDVAQSIKYPPAPQTTTPLFLYPYHSREEPATGSTDLIGTIHRDNGLKPAADAGFRRNGLVGSREDDPPVNQARRALGSKSFHEPGEEHGVRVAQRSGLQRQPKPQPPPSTASSADGYDSFENTNNKKKRKIPIAGETILNGTHVLNEPASFGIPSPPTTVEDDGVDHVTTSTSYYSGGALSSGQGISGPGRGRYGRIRNGRSPLRALSDSNANWTGRNMKLRSAGQYPSPPAESLGIISTAIASAEKFPMAAGQENVSLLQQQIPTKPSSRTSTQFTFTFGAQNLASWPGSDPAPHGISGSHRAHHPSSTTEYHGTTARSTQTRSGTSPNLSGLSNTHPTDDNFGKGAPNAADPPKKSKRRGNSLLRAARQRRRDTEYQNMHHPPAPEDYYLCEFCEYELIFGHAPEALIRQYEIKDRRRRREEAERRRLLEKAKMKSRKGKKASTSKGVAAKGSISDRTSDRTSVAANDAQHQPPIAHRHDQDEGDEIRSEAFDSDDNYDDHLSHEDEMPTLVPDERYVQPTYPAPAGAPDAGGGPPTRRR